MKNHDIDNGKYYKFIYEHMKNIKHISYSYDVLKDIIINYL